MASFTGKIHRIEKAVHTFWRVGVQIFHHFQSGADGDLMDQMNFGTVDIISSQTADVDVLGVTSDDIILAVSNDDDRTVDAVESASDGQITIALNSSAPATGTRVSWLVIKAGTV